MKAERKLNKIIYDLQDLYEENINEAAKEAIEDAITTLERVFIYYTNQD